MALKALLIVCFLSVSAYAAETAQEFSFQSVEGKTIEYRATTKVPYVVNIGAHEIKGGGFFMAEKDITQLLSGMSQAAKKDFLDGLVVHILSELNEDVKKDLLRTVLAGQKENRQLSSMVEY